MNSELESFVEKARNTGWDDAKIEQQLLAAGWEASAVRQSLGKGDELVVPLPPGHQVHTSSHSPADHPIAVVENLTPRGFEYKIFSVSLILLLLAVIFIANILFNSSEDWNTEAFPLTMLIVTGPIALFLFLRLHRAELLQPALKHDASRRKVVQAIQLVTFLGVIGHTIALLYLIISGHYAASTDASYRTTTPSLLGGILRWVVTLLVAGGTFWYYWHDEHKNV